MKNTIALATLLAALPIGIKPYVVIKILANFQPHANAIQTRQTLTMPYPTP